HNMVTWLIDRFGTEEQRQKYGPRLCSMEIMASYCLTEPGSGSDAASLKTRAKILTNPADSLNNIYVINGAKAFISGGGASDIYLVMARTGGDGPGGISAFIVEKDFPGLGFGAQEKKLGWKSQPTAAVTFDDCQVPAENLLGGEGNGFKLAMAGLDGGRVNIAACSLGGAAECLDRATQYAQERKQFGKAIADFQATGFKLADMATNLDAARLMVHDACMAIDMEAPDKTVKAAKAKRLATDACYQVVDDALQIHGGYGYLADYEIERYKRDLRVHRILEGTNEIMRVIISRDLLSSGRNH
ncbi:MAG: acyl-CoA dehydrogenase family protein, partial [Pseudomonadota bacterium]